MNETPNQRSPLGDEDYDDEYPEPRPRGRGRLVAAGVAALVLLGGGGALALSGGGGDNDPESESSGEGASTSEVAMFEFAKCMRDHGLEDFPDPEVDADGGISFNNQNEQRSSPNFEEADEACQPSSRTPAPGLSKASSS
jgi:hypothetical protein